jgi:uroporphyrinogen decarboxylase
MNKFQPDYKNLEDAARNIEAKRLPLYDHIISPLIMEKLLGYEFTGLLDGNRADKKEYYRAFCGAFLKMEYDVVVFEGCMAHIMPGAGALGGHKPGVIKTAGDFNKYPWDELPDMYFAEFGEAFELIREVMPDGMKAVGGVGNGIFESVQELVGYMDLCYIKVDDPELYANLFRKAGDVLTVIWERFLKTYGDIFCVARFGDDLGFKNGLLLSDDDIKEHILPQYKRIINLAHKSGKPFLLHSCGNIFDIMDDIIDTGINAKHSNEDVIVPFSRWVSEYGKQIGNFGGIDTDVICGDDTAYIKKYTTEILKATAKGNGGIAIGTGNSIPDYVSVAGYTAMNEAVREFRGYN